MCNVSELSYAKLVLLKDEVDNLLSLMNPIRLKKRFKRCGRKDCFCVNGPRDGSWGNLHGPYVFASYTEKKGVYRSRSLGLYYSEEDRLAEAEKLSSKLLLWVNFYTLSAGDASRRSVNEVIHSRVFTEEEFVGLYGIPTMFDRLGRPTTLYATDAKFQAYKSECREQGARQDALLRDEYADLGICSPIGQKVLDEILSGPYYLKA